MTDKTFRSWDPDQQLLFPPSIKDFVPAGHMAHFVRDLVRNDLDLSAIHARYTERRGQPPYHPALMTSLLLYSYSRGIYSSRRIERACEERVDFMALTGGEKPDHSTICCRGFSCRFSRSVVRRGWRSSATWPWTERR
jgi:transposase